MSLKVYVDTNVFLDSILSRDNGIARKILYFLEDKNFEIILNDVSIINMHYFSNKAKRLTPETVGMLYNLIYYNSLHIQIKNHPCNTLFHNFPIINKLFKITF